MCVIDPKRKKIVVLRRKCPYTKNAPPQQSLSDRPENKKRLAFVEQFCIPRGCQNTYESAFNCGIREFIEECGFFFKSFYKLPHTFDLEWEDPKDVIWRYKISFICVDVESIFIPSQEKVSQLVDFVSKQCHNSKKTYTTFDPTPFVGEECESQPRIFTQFNIKDKVVQNLNSAIVPIYSKNFKRLQKREFIQPSIMDIGKYFELINIQKKLYIKNNYSRFLQFIGTQLRLLSQ